MYNFPVIRHIDDLMAHVGHLNYINATKKDNDTIIVCYSYADKDSFANEWERECRGITFDSNGYIISRTLHKFFNLGERESYSPKKLDFSKVKAIFPKLDGSMISTYVLNGEVVAKSKKSECSDVALDANIFLKNNKAYLDFCKDMFEKGLTPTFEFTSPKNRIVVKYLIEELTLLQVRDNITGKYLDIHEVSKGYDVKVLDSSYSDKNNFEDLVSTLETMRDVEGVIVMFEDGDMVKIKTPWYIGLHHSVTFKRYRDIAKLVLNESLDDFRGFLALQKYDAIDFKTLDEVESKILNQIQEIRESVDLTTEKARAHAEVDGKVDFKKASDFLRDTNVVDYYFNFTMNQLRGNENDYLYYYKKNLLRSNWSLETIPINTDSVN